MRLPLLGTVCATLMLVAGCDSENAVRISSTANDAESKGILKVVDTLQCPETQGVLTRKGTAQAGGSVCSYSGPRGAEVSLHLVTLETETADGVIARFEAMLASAMPHTLAELRASADADQARVAADSARIEADTARIQADAARASADAALNPGDQTTIQGPGVTVQSGEEKADVRLPGLSIKTEGDRASVRIGGFRIDADDSTGRADISSSDDSISIQAHDDAAAIRTRVPGEATRASYRLTDDTPADEGWRMVGYEARGPAGGPIVVVTVRTKDRDNDSVFDSARDLITLNVGE